MRKLSIRGAWLLAVLVAVTFVINLAWFDEDLHPDIARLVPPRAVSMDDNAYPVLYGFRAADDRDARAAGLQIIERLRSRYAAGEPVSVTEAEMLEILGNAGADDWSAVYPGFDCNSAFEADCADRLIVDVMRNHALPPRFRLLLDRYEEALQSARFEENQEFDATTPIPEYGALLGASRVALALSYRDEPIDVFLADAGRDIAFWKIMLRDGQSLIAKMVALAGLRNDTNYLSLLLRERVLEAADIVAVREILTPLSEDERDIGETFIAELRIALLSRKDLAVLVEGPSWMTALALQERATINESYFKTTVPLQLRATLSAAEFYRQRGYEPLSYDVRAVPPPLYNLGGRFVLKWAAAEMNVQDYISRVHDLNGRIALVLLQTEIEAGAGRPVAEIVKTSQYRNPYTGEPMHYDRNAGTIGFDCLANDAVVCTLEIGTQR